MTLEIFTSCEKTTRIKNGLTTEVIDILDMVSQIGTVWKIINITPVYLTPIGTMSIIIYAGEDSKVYRILTEHSLITLQENLKIEYNVTLNFSLLERS